MGNNHSNEKSSTSVVSNGNSVGNGNGDTKPTTVATTTTIITDGSFKSRRRSHNRKSKSKESPNKVDQTGNTGNRSADFLIGSILAVLTGSITV